MQIRNSFIALGLVAASAFTGAPAFAIDCSKAPSTVLFCDDFESGALNGRKWNVSGNSPTIASSPARGGTKSMKSYLNRATSPKSFRTEVSSGGHVDILPGGEYWYAFSVYLPSDYATDNIWEMVAQWHNVPDQSKGEATDLNPPLSLNSANGEWMISTIWDSRILTLKSSYEGKERFYLGPYKKGVWTDWVFHMKWSPFSDGLLQVWQDGKLVVNKKGGLAFNDVVGPYMKLGIYKGWSDRTSPVGNVSQRTLYHDDVVVASKGATYNDVAPSNAKLAAPATPAAFRKE